MSYTSEIMHKLNCAELIECAEIARDIVQTLKSKSWNVIDWPAHELKSSRMMKTKVTLAACPGNYSNTTLITGTSRITITVPNQGFIPARVTAQQISKLQKVIYGAIAHECVHVLQKHLVREAFDTSEALEARLFGMSVKTVDDKLELYIGQLLEREARAAQAAAEVEFLIGPGKCKALFDAELPNTEVYQRTEKDIGGPADTKAEVAAWWNTWIPLAYDAYVSLPTRA